MVLLPTPPLALLTATMFLTLGMARFSGRPFRISRCSSLCSSCWEAYLVSSEQLD